MRLQIVALAFLASGLTLLGTAQADLSTPIGERDSIITLPNEQSAYGVAAPLKEGQVLRISIQAEHPLDLLVRYSLQGGPMSGIYLQEPSIVSFVGTLRLPWDAIWDVTVDNAVGNPNEVGFSVNVIDPRIEVALFASGTGASTVGIILTGIAFWPRARVLRLPLRSRMKDE